MMLWEYSTFFQKLAIFFRINIIGNDTDSDTFLLKQPPMLE